MNKFLLVMIASIFTGGCAFMGAGNEVVLGDGISKQEAKVIAQRELARAGRDKIYAKAKVRNDGANWRVLFAPSSPNIFSSQYFSYYIIEIDKNSGEIQRSETTEALSDILEDT